jgi:8-oxo-dGTP pyrophosphatase MutT (NUDIX family)
MSIRYEPALRRQMARNLESFPIDAIPDPGHKRAAVAVVVVEAEPGVAGFVLTRRASRLNSHAGQWALPGGRLDPGETPEVAALRELSEEVNLLLPPEAILGRLDDYPTRSGYLITPVVVWAGAEEMVANPDEVDTIHRIPLAELNREGSPEFISIPESDRPVVRLLINDQKIHAPTAAIVYQFREVALHGRPTRVSHLEQPVFAWR